MHGIGAGKLHTHQAQAIKAVRRGQHVFECTGIPSGKPLAYNVPVLEALIAGPAVLALYLFPTEALAQDQLRSLRQPITNDLKTTRAGTYDGNTPRSARARLRREVSIVLTNPERVGGVLL